MQTSLVFTNTSKSDQSWRLLFDKKIHSDFPLGPNKSTNPVYVGPSGSVAISVTTGTTAEQAELNWQDGKFVLAPTPIWNLTLGIETAQNGPE
ncbi:MAG TPA: hypothetical protein VGL80_05230 [Pseudonocardiaceae bacterium]